MKVAWLPLTTVFVFQHLFFMTKHDHKMHFKSHDKNILQHIWYSWKTLSTKVKASKTTKKLNKTLTSVIICGLKNKKKNQEDGQIQQTKTFTSVWYSWVNLLNQQVNTQSLRGWLKEVETEKKIGLWGRLWAYNQLCVRLRVCHASRCQFPLPTLQNLKPPHSGLECAVC